MYQQQPNVGTGCTAILKSESAGAKVDLWALLVIRANCRMTNYELLR